jgi:hypothetical protein
VVWEIDDVAMTCLDLQLGVPATYDRFGTFARNSAGTPIVVEFHATRDYRVGRAHPDTIGPIVVAAIARGFPPEYVDELLEWDMDFAS